MRRCALLGLLLMLAGGALTAPAVAFERIAEPYFETVVSSETLPYGVVTVLLQDRSGRLWVGSQQGVWSYDGYRLRPLQVPGAAGSALRAAYVYTLADGPGSDRLWIGTQSDGLLVYSRSTGQLQQLPALGRGDNGLGDNAIYALAADAQGGVWVGSNAGLAYLQPAAQAVERVPILGIDERVRAILLDRSGALWVGTLNGLFRRPPEGGEFEPMRLDAALSSRITTLFESSDGAVWVGTQTEGARRIDPQRRSAMATPVDDAGDLANSWVRAFIEPQPGQLWIATWGAGIAVIDMADQRLVRRIEHDRAMPGSLGLDYVGAFWLDRSGLLWLGTWGGGLQRHNPTAQAFRSLRHRPLKAHTLSQADVYSLHEDADGLLWVGLDGRGIDIVDRQRGVIRSFVPDAGNPHALGDGTISGITRTRDGTLWVGTQQAGLHRYDDATRRFRRLGPQQGLVDKSVRRLLASRSGHLWVGTEAGLDRLDPATERFDHVVDGDGRVVATAFWVLVEDATGRLWAGTPAGLFVVEPDAPLRLKPVVTVPGGALSHQQVRGLLVDSQQRVWVDTAGGLDRLASWDGQRARFESVGAQLGRPGLALGGNLQQDHAGRIWSARFRYDPAQGRVEEFGRADGVDIGNNWVGSYTTTRDGLLLFGGTEGVLIIDPSRDPAPGRDFEPPLLVTEVRVDGQVPDWIPGNGPLLLQPHQRRVSIEFAALDFAAPEKNRYAYRLEGVDRDWINTDAGNRVASYNNLWPGDYVLHLRGSNRAGRFTETDLRLPLRVLPAFWQTPWFAALLLLAVGASVAGGVHWRTARIRARARELKAIVEQRTAELRGALDELRRTQHSLVEQEKMASLGGLVAGVAHEINTPLGVALTASSHLDESIRGLFAKFDAHRLTPADLAEFRQSAAESTRLVLDCLVRARELVASFKRVAVDRSREPLRRIQLAAMLDELAAGWRSDPRFGGVDIRLGCPADLVLDSYPGALGQVLNELADNSLQHGFGGNRQGCIEIHAEPRTDGVRLRYRDNGAGMSPEVVAQAFEPFFTTRRGSGSVGLGLHVAYNLTTRLLGGSMSLRSTPGVGSEVEVTLPRSGQRTGTVAI